MISKTEKLAALMSHMPICDIEPVYTHRRAVDHAAAENFERAIQTDAWEELINIQDDALLTDDGREILRAHGKAWALTPEIHAQRLAEAFEQAKQRDAATKEAEYQSARSAPQTTCTALIDGQLCGGTLAMAPVCPRCALGKSGVAATLTCDVCGHVTAVMRGDK